MPTSLRDTCLRVDIPRTDGNIVDSSIAKITYNTEGDIVKSSVITSPMVGVDITKENIKERLEDVLWRSMNFTSKLIGVDELTGMRHNENDMKLHIIKGIACRNTHHCAGNIVYHPESSYMLKWLDLLFWEEYGVIFNNSLEGQVSVPRSSGKIDKTGKINKSECIRWSSTCNDWVIRVSLDNGEKEKHVSLTDIHKYNPDMELNITLPSRKIYEDSPKWVLEIYDSWIKKMPTKFGSVNDTENQTSKDIIREYSEEELI